MNTVTMRCLGLITLPLEVSAKICLSLKVHEIIFYAKVAHQTYNHLDFLLQNVALSYGANLKNRHRYIYLRDLWKEVKVLINFKLIPPHLVCKSIEDTLNFLPRLSGHQLCRVISFWPHRSKLLKIKQFKNLRLFCLENKEKFLNLNTNERGVSALSLALTELKRSEQIIPFLLEMESDPQIIDLIYKDTPLHVAVIIADITAIKILIKYDASTIQVNTLNETPVDCVSIYHPPFIYSRLYEALGIKSDSSH